MIDGDEFRKLLGRWTTGVTIVTTCAGEKIHGMTVSAFTEVSLSPPLVLVCADKGSHTHPVIEAGRVFAVNVLAAGQEELSDRFASKRDEWRRFEGLDWETAESGAPVLPGCVATFDCRVVAAHDTGDHVVYVGEVLWVDTDPEREPLLYASGSYGRFRS